MSTRSVLNCAAVVVLAAGAVAAALALLTGSAQAAGAAAAITVNTTTDELNADGDCSLREAIQAANTDAAVDACPAGAGADTVFLPAGAYTLALAGAGEDANQTGDLDILDALTLQGAGPAASVIDAAALDRGLHAMAEVALLDLTVRNGAVTGPGGGLYAGRAARMTNADFVGNTASESGGGAYFHEAATVAGATFSGNTSYDGGGADFNGTATVVGAAFTGNTANYRGGGAKFNGAATVINTTFSNNVIPGGEGGGIYNSGALTLTSNTVNNNTSGIYGGGIFNSGALTLNNSTVNSNASINGGGVFNGGVLVLKSSTVSSNTASQGGGVKSNGVTMTVRNSILAGNQASEGSHDCDGNVTSEGYNLIGIAAGCNFTPTVGDLINVDPALDRLQDNGGSTFTQGLLPGSPAINASDPAGCMGSEGVLMTDQRGYPRFGRCDIGAYELQPIGFSSQTASRAQAVPGTVIRYTLALANPGASTLANVLVTDTLPGSLTYVANSLSATAGDPAYANGAITWAGALKSGELVTLTYQARIGQTVPFGTVITNPAVISGGGELIIRSATVKVAPEQIYLPFLRKPRRVIFGRVTQNGAPAAGVTLLLRFYDGANWSTRASTITAADGAYEFLNPPNLAPGHKYYVRYQNSDGPGARPDRLWAWWTRELTSYGGGEIDLGSFDIANITLTAPGNEWGVSLPQTFRWTPRPATPTDSYEFDLFDPEDGDPYAYTAPLGYVDGFTLHGLPNGFETYTWYLWNVWVYGPNGGYGVSYWSQWVYFTNTGGGWSTGAPAHRLSHPPDRRVDDWLGQPGPDERESP